MNGARDREIDAAIEAAKEYAPLEPAALERIRRRLEQRSRARSWRWASSVLVGCASALIAMWIAAKEPPVEPRLTFVPAARIAIPPAPPSDVVATKSAPVPVRRAAPARKKAAKTGALPPAQQDSVEEPAAPSIARADEPSAPLELDPVLEPQRMSSYRPRAFREFQEGEGDPLEVRLAVQAILHRRDVRRWLAALEEIPLEEPGRTQTATQPE